MQPRPLLHVALALASVLPGPARAQAGDHPTLDHEPTLIVLLARAQRVSVELERATRLEVGDAATTLGAGTLELEAHDDGWRIAGGKQTVQRTGTLRSSGAPSFSLEAIPLFGEPRRLRLAGDLLVQAVEGQLEVSERIGMEAYLASVVGAEMNAKWPEQALAAQAIVARSYAAARWMERHAERWQLHWHFGVDMAYHGWSESDAKVARAIAPTRGELLVYRGFPVLALFHASSGGRTEAFDRIKPGVFAPDGVTSISAAMPVVDDPAALPGAQALSLSASHGRWKADIPLGEVTRGLQAWSKAGKDRPRFGQVEAVSILERHPDSGRVSTVSVRHRLEGRERFKTMLATDFRLAVSPVRIRSVWWERCVIASKGDGFLVLEGRGFGHGCGMSQVSAWHLATRGESARAIVGRFYAGARIEKRY